MNEPLEAFVMQRRAHVTQHGPMAVDAMLGVARCTKCGGYAVFALGSNPVSDYESLEDLVHLAGTTAADMAVRAPPRRCPCGGKLEPSSVEYHAFHSGLGRDVVAVWTPKKSLFGKASVELFTWDPFQTRVRDMTALGEMSPADLERFVREAQLRCAWVLLEEDHPDAPLIAMDVAERFPAEPLVLRLLPILLQRRHMPAAIAVADRIRKARRDDPEGHAAFGEILFTAIRHDLEPRSRIDESRSALDAALALAPDHRAALMALGNLLMFEERLDEARATFRRLVERHPDYAAAHFDLGLLLLDGDPAAALEHFQAGERHAIADADYPVGCARAFLALGRTSEAAEALKRARNLTAQHPRFAELEKALADRAY